MNARFLLDAETENLGAKHMGIHESRHYSNVAAEPDADGVGDCNNSVRPSIERPLSFQNTLPARPMSAS